jgi:tRNA A-37 threonylcarbamoyl transferase component Bud32
MMETDSQIIGKMIDSYEITELIGRGGMGVVYKARDVKLDRDVALKIMDPLLAREEAFLKRFWSEAKALAKLQSPYIVGIYALRETEFGICIVMEYVEGRTLGDLVKASGPLKPEHAAYLFKQLLMGFEHAHAHGIIHRDVKPGNILVTADNIAKITDFGLAKIYQPSAATLTSITGGTLFYASPEQLEGLGKVDQRGDIYSLGMTFYESLTGAVPFANTESDFAIREKIVKGKIPSPRGMKPEIPAELNSIIMKAIAKDPQDRFQTALEMREALEDFEASFKRARAKTVRAPRRAFRPLWLLVPAVLLLMIAGVLLVPSLFPEKAMVSILSIPDGARVMIGGKFLSETPIHDHLVDAGEIRVTVSDSGYDTKDCTLTVLDGDELDLRFELQRRASPQNAELIPPSTIVTPPVVHREILKTEEVRKSEPKKEALAPSVSVNPQPATASTRITEPPKPKKTGSINVEVNPPNSRVSINHKVVDVMPCQVDTGTYFVEVVSDANFPPYMWSGNVTVKEGKTVTVPVNFMKKVKITVRAIDTKGNKVVGAKIFCDGILAPLRTFATIEMSYGIHRITVEKDGYKEKTVQRCFERNMVVPDPILDIVLLESNETSPDE